MYITTAKMLGLYQKCVDMSDDEYVKWSERAWDWGIGVTKDDGVVEQNRGLFLSLRVVSLRVLESKNEVKDYDCKC